MRDDLQLVERLRCGDAAALCDLYLRHKDLLLTTATCLLLDDAAAEDVLHDLFVGLAENAARHRIRRNVQGYLVASVANRARDELRRRARGERLRAGVLERGGHAIESGSPAPVDSGIELGALYTALADIPVEQREVLVLHLQGGMTFRQIARHQAVGTNTAKSRYRYGLNGLRARLEQGVQT